MTAWQHAGAQVCSMQAGGMQHTALGSGRLCQSSWHDALAVGANRTGATITVITSRTMHHVMRAARSMRMQPAAQALAGDDHPRGGLTESDGRPLAVRCVAQGGATGRSPGGAEPPRSPRQPGLTRPVARRGWRCMRECCQGLGLAGTLGTVRRRGALDGGAPTLQGAGDGCHDVGLTR